MSNSSKCPVCRKKEMNWLHEISCREHNPLAWFFLDFNRAVVNKNGEGERLAVRRYWDTVNAKC